MRQLFCAEKIPSISVVQPVLRALKKKFLVITETDQKVSADMKTTISTSVHSHFQDCAKNKAMLSATALDPRHKTLKFLKSPEREAIFEDVISKASFLREMTEVTSGSPKRRKLSSIARDLLDYSESSGSSPSSGTQSPFPEFKSAIEREMHYYRAEEATDKSEDPLTWWKLNHHRFPTLSMLARRYLTTQATSVPSERLFSKAGMVVCKKRASLNPSTVDCLLFLHGNWKLLFCCYVHCVSVSNF